MKFLLSTSSAAGAERLGTPLMGVPLGVRALVAAARAGASGIEVSGPHAARLVELGQDPRVGVPVTEYRASREERVVVEPNAVVAPDLLRGLGPGEALLSDTEQLVAARRVFEPGDKPSTPLRGLPVMDVPQSPKLYAVLVQDDGDVARAVAALLRAEVQPTDPPWTRAVLRPLAARAAAAFVRVGVPATGLSAASLLTAVLAAWLLSLGGSSEALFAAPALLLAAWLGSVDGSVARLSLRDGGTGVTLNRVVDDSARILACVGAILGLVRTSGLTWLHGVAAGPVVLWFALQAFRPSDGPVPPSALRTLVHRDTVLPLVALAAAADFRWPVALLWPLVVLGELALALRARR